MSHNHTSHLDLKHNNLIIATVLNFLITIAEIVGGILSNSLSLISDALHNFSDGLALLVAFFANKIGKRESNERKTFGYKRIEILAALFNSIILAVICIYLFIEAYKRLLNPQPIDGKIMFIVAGIGLFANLLSAYILKKDAGKNLNIKAAYLHLIGDTLSSIAVIIGGIFIYYFDIYWLDPVITFLVGIYILFETSKIIKDTINILMQATPSGLNLTEIKSDLEQLPEITNIHHIHAWNLDDQHIHFECHVDLNGDFRVKETEKIRHEIEEILFQKYQVSHLTVQFEYNTCGDKTIVSKKQI